MRAIEAIRDERVVAVLRRVADVPRVVAALRVGGTRIFEITLDSADALEAIATLRSNPELVVLAGGRGAGDSRHADAERDRGRVTTRRGDGEALPGIPRRPAVRT